MKIKRHQHEGLFFHCREGTSDKKTFDEVLVRRTYERRYFQISNEERWIDLGGNVGAFTVRAASIGAKVDVYEPDPFNCKMIEKNIKANNLDANIHQKAVVSNNSKKMKMYVGNNNQVWRNSLYKDWGNQSFNVDCVHFSEVLTPEINLKMDIEGAEMDILEAMSAFPKRMVFEWSFDIDPDIDRYRKVLDKLSKQYQTVKAPTYREDYSVWPDSWFPPCANVYCYEDNTA